VVETPTDAEGDAGVEADGAGAAGAEGTGAEPVIPEEQAA
jgi:hypothetical protein